MNVRRDIPVSRYLITPGGLAMLRWLAARGDELHRMRDVARAMNSEQCSGYACRVARQLEPMGLVEVDELPRPDGERGRRWQAAVTITPLGRRLVDASPDAMVTVPRKLRAVLLLFPLDRLPVGMDDLRDRTGRNRNSVHRSLTTASRLELIERGVPWTTGVDHGSDTWRYRLTASGRALATVLRDLP